MNKSKLQHIKIYNIFSYRKNQSGYMIPVLEDFVLKEKFKGRSL